MAHTAPNQKRLIVVLGMHRSGTSVITRALQVLGVSLGTRLMPAVENNNQKGFWEDLDINALNIALLKALGHEWHGFTPILPAELAAPAAMEFQGAALDVLRARLSNTDCFGVKDPRMCRLLPFWQNVFAQLQVNVSYVIVCRNPMSVAHSLSKRDGFDLEKGYYLWLEHMLRSLAATKDRHFIVVDYDRFLEAPAEQLQGMAQGLSLKFDAGGPEAAEFMTDFLEHSLRHHCHLLEDLQGDQSVPANVTALYKILLEMAARSARTGNPEPPSELAQLQAQQQNDYSWFRYLEIWEQRTAALTQQTNEAQRRIVELTSAVKRLEAEEARLSFQLNAICSSRSWKTARLLHRIVLPFKRLAHLRS